MKGKRKILTAILTAILCIGLFSIAAMAGSQKKITVTYGQTEARTMLEMLNEFRTGSDAWYWNKDNTKKVKVSGLKKLTYDYDLEAIAMQRAAELVFSYSHTRPNGTSCFTAYNEAGYSRYSAGENAGMGWPTAEEIMEAWKETDLEYSGQGHRRTMLSDDYNAVGFGHAYYEGIHYWVQSFAGTTNSSSKTKANDSATVVIIQMAD